jgi:hypothetical protein
LVLVASPTVAWRSAIASTSMMGVRRLIYIDGQKPKDEEKALELLRPPAPMHVLGKTPRWGGEQWPLPPKSSN